MRLDRHALVARLQVHDTLLDWWFGNASISVPVDTAFAHAQPSIYASFIDIMGEPDPVGDITGHGYVTLTAPAGRLVVTDNGRLRGIAEGEETITGTMHGTTHTLKAQVVDYGKAREELDVVRAKNVTSPETAHNMVFIGEGFRDTDDDKKRFSEIVTKTADSLFTKSRHQPFGLLEKSFNVWKAYAPSAQHGVTCGFRLNETGVKPGPARGTAIPHEKRVASKTNYTVQELVRVVGLPSNDEERGRDALVALWNTQSLAGFDAARVDEKLVTAWKTQKTSSILEASDTFFGFRLGSRPGNRNSRRGAPVLPPSTDDGADPLLAPFIERLYEFFTFEDARVVLLDPRRNAVEVLADPWSDANPGTPIMRYLSNLRARQAPHVHVGPVWVPDPAQSTFKPSVGLVAVILNEGLDGGSSICASSMTGTAVSALGKTDFTLNTAEAQRPMRRTLPPSFETKIGNVIDTVAHEFGHSFNLGDEYEENGLDPDANSQRDGGLDNVTRLGTIYHHGNVEADDTIDFIDDEIDPAKVKWLALLRMRVSSVLTADSVGGGGSGRVVLDDRAEADPRVGGAQDDEPDRHASGPELPRVQPATAPLRRAHGYPDWSLARPHRPREGHDRSHRDRPAGGRLCGLREGRPPVQPADGGGQRTARIVERKVLDHLTATHKVLNTKTNNTRKNKEADHPVEIAGYSPPCKSHKVIGVYEGALEFAGRTYRPAGLCKMRKQSDKGVGDGSYCHVCKWLIVNRVDANLLALLDISLYPKGGRAGMPDRGTFATVLAETGQALLPLQRALESPEAFFALMVKLGWDAPAVPAPLQQVGAGLTSLFETLERILGEGLQVEGTISLEDDPTAGAAVSVSPDDIVRGVDALRQVIGGIRAIASAPDAAFPPHLIADGFKEKLPRQLVDHLLVSYLQTYHGGLAFALRALGVIKTTYVEPAGQRLPHIELHASTCADLPKVLESPSVVLHNAFGWGGPDFDAAAFLSQVDDLLQTIDIDTRDRAAVAQRRPTRSRARRSPTRRRGGCCAASSSSGPAATDTMSADLRLIPLPARGPDQPGLCLMPAFNGLLDVKMQLFDDIAVTIRTDLKAEGGIAPADAAGTAARDRRRVRRRERAGVGLGLDRRARRAHRPRQRADDPARLANEQPAAVPEDRRRRRRADQRRRHRGPVRRVRAEGPRVPPRHVGERRLHLDDRARQRHRLQHRPRGRRLEPAGDLLPRHVATSRSRCPCTSSSGRSRSRG